MAMVDIPIAARRISSQRRVVPAVLLVTALIYAIYIGLSIRPYANNLSALIVAGDRMVPAGAVGSDIVVLRHTTGYDGLLYYYVADDPFLQHPERQAHLLHKGAEPKAAFIYQRIGYPLLVWATSLGRRPWRPVAMVGVNMLAILVIAYLFSGIQRLYGKDSSWWWALACAINPSLLIGMQMDLAEPTAFALALGGMLLYLRRQVAAAALVLAGALLTREVAFLFILPLLVAEILARRLRPALILSLAVIPYVAWGALVARVFGRSAAATTRGNFDVPLAGIKAVVMAARRAPLRYALVHQGSILVFALLVLVALGVSIAYLARSKSYDIAWGGMLVHSAAALFAGWEIWIDYASAARVFGGLYVFIILAFARHRTAALALLVAGTIALTFFTLIRPAAITPGVPYFVTP